MYTKYYDSHIKAFWIIRMETKKKVICLYKCWYLVTTAVVTNVNIYICLSLTTVVVTKIRELQALSEQIKINYLGGKKNGKIKNFLPEWSGNSLYSLH